MALNDQFNNRMYLCPEAHFQMELNRVIYDGFGRLKFFSHQQKRFFYAVFVIVHIFIKYLIIKPWDNKVCEKTNENIIHWKILTSVLVHSIQNWMREIHSDPNNKNNLSNELRTYPRDILQIDTIKKTIKYRQKNPSDEPPLVIDLIPFSYLEQYFKQENGMIRDLLDEFANNFYVKVYEKVKDRS